MTRVSGVPAGTAAAAVLGYAGYLTFAAAKQASLQRSPVVRAIFALRSMPSRLRGTPAPPRDERGILEQTRSLGWGVLAETSDREIVVGAVTQP